MKVITTTSGDSEEEMYEITDEFDLSAPCPEKIIIEDGDMEVVFKNFDKRRLIATYKVNNDMLLWNYPTIRLKYHYFFRGKDEVAFCPANPVKSNISNRSVNYVYYAYRGVGHANK